MTLDDCNRLMKHWSKFPPLRDLVAGFIGFEIEKDEEPDEQKYMSADDFHRMMAMTGGKIPGME
jgi:hypothetical protein